jgi:RNA polymerase sigma-70 factor, ECF subfamily
MTTASRGCRPRSVRAAAALAVSALMRAASSRPESSFTRSILPSGFPAAIRMFAAGANRPGDSRYQLSKAETSGRSKVNDPHRNTGAAAFADRRGPAGDDAELLRRISKDDEDAMAAFYREHGRVVLAQVLLVTGERALAEEIVQDTMLAVWRGAASFRGESSVRSWVIAIARRQTRDRLRGRRLRVVDDAFLADQPGSEPGPEALALDRAELAEVAGAIRRLASAHRELLGLVFGSGLSLPEVAGVLDIPLGTVKSRLSGTAVTVMGAMLGQLRTGASTKALGYAGPDGTLSALAVAQPSGWPPGAHATISVRNCSSTAINHEILALASGG